MHLSRVLTSAVLLLLPIEILSLTTTNLTTPSGPISGQIVDVPDGSNRKVKQFLSIPYALPPTGERRFKAPDPIPAWTETVLAHDWPAACPQLVNNASVDFELFHFITQPAEDCLYLNVWSPVPEPSNAAVLVWIYGGGFTEGSASTLAYDGRILAAHTNLIIVTLQYRVGPIGFLSLGTSEAPGNMGLSDQRLAMKWVHENIQSFGGDPEKITIFGESAGSGSVSFHLMSEGSHPYFNRAIMESGTVVSPWASVRKDESINVTLQFADNVGCTSDRDKLDEVVECLRGIDVDTLIQNAANPLGLTPFLPVDGDGVFLTDTISNLLQQKSFKKTEILLGANKNEGSMFLPIYAVEYVLNSTTFEMAPITLENYTTIINRMFVHLTDVQRQAVRFMYRDWNEPNSADMFLSSLEQALGDTWFLCPTTKFADIYEMDNLPAYVYLFSQQSSYFPDIEWAGIMHAEELPFVFGIPLITDGSVTEATNEEKDVSRMMMEYWRNFAETGNPSSDSTGQEALGGVWPQRIDGSGGGKFLHIVGGDRPLATGIGPRSKYCSFWYNYIPSLPDTTETECPDNGSERHVTYTMLMMVGLVTSYLLLNNQRTVTIN